MSKAKKDQLFIVVYNDDAGLCIPYGWDMECEGALCSGVTPFVAFDSRKDARDAVNVSKAFARLNAAQGKVFNDDFTTHIKNVRVWPLSRKE